MVQRYAVITDLPECDEGEVVAYEDYVALEERLREVQGQLERLARAYASLTDKDK